MRKLFLCGFLVLFLGCNVFGYTIDNKSKLEKIERETNTYYGENIPFEQRVKNAEIYVFGTEKKGDINKRIEELSNILGLNSQTPETPKYEIADDTKANYPSIDKIEMKVFGKTYKNENVYSRLERLEKKEFGKVSSSSLSERVASLQDKFEEKSFEKNTAPQQHKTYSYNYYSPATYSELSLFEKKLLGKSYDNEDLSKRLSRVENKLFSRDFDYEDSQTRLERLKSVHKAAKTGTEYKVNKFAKYAIAGAQIGGILLLILAMIL